jgi:hypothetical protein
VIRHLAGLILAIGLAYGGEVCSQPETAQSGSSPELSWASFTKQLAPKKICTQQEITPNSPAPLSVGWPGAGILEASITGRFAVAFCCLEETAVRKDSLRFGAPPKTLPTRVIVGAGDPDRDDEYPDLIEDDAKSIQTLFKGSVWDGARLVKLDLELRAAASHPHLKQSVLQFVVVDQSSEPVSVEWDLVRKLSATVKPFFTETPKDRSYRETTYVFFAGNRPAPARSLVEVRTGAGKLLGRFAVGAFTMKRK